MLGAVQHRKTQYRKVEKAEKNFDIITQMKANYTTTFTRQPFLYRCRVILRLWFLYVKYYAVHKTSTKCSVNNAKCLLNNICATLFHNFVTIHVVVTSLFEKDRCRYF